MKVVILGGTGFLGSHLATRLASSGHDVSAIGRRSVSSPTYEVASFDLFATTEISPFLRDADVCIHLANDLVPSTAERAGYMGLSRNLELANRIADSCGKCGVSKLVFASSGGTLYGRDTLAATEETPCRPIGLYGVQKLAVEALLRANLRGSACSFLSLRIGNPYGPGQERQRAHGVIGHLLGALISGGTFTVWGDGTQVRDYVYIEDVMDAFEAALNYSGDEDAINIGSGVGTATSQLIEICESITGKNLRVAYSEHPFYDVDRISLDVTKARTSLGWRPRTELTDGVRFYFQAISEDV